MISDFCANNLSSWLRLALALSPFVGYLLVFKNYLVLRDALGLGPAVPDLATLPWLERALFWCLPHRVFGAFACLPLDLLAAIPYLVHFPLPVLFAVYLGVNRQRRGQMYSFLWCAGWVNFLAVVVQFFYPSGPPWYKDTAEFDVDGVLLRCANNEAGFERLDRLVGSPFFHSIYAASPVKFGAMPSLHVAWPCIILMCKPWVSERFASLHLLWIFWAALYSNHHYGVDAVAGILLTIAVRQGMTRIYCPFRVDDQDDAVPVDNLHHGGPLFARPSTPTVDSASGKQSAAAAANLYP